MANLNNDNLNILDLPGEILFMIFNKLNITDVLYSLVDVNKQFDRLVLDSLYVRGLDMTDKMTINSLYDETSSIDTKILPKICEKILSRIQHQVHKLTVEQYSIKNVLRAGNYPKLHYLSLINFQEEILHQHLTVDCLYLLDGRLDSLAILIINVGQIFDPIIDIGSRKKLPKLKYLSFTASSPTCYYDILIVPLLCRMINIEELKLYLSIHRFNSIYIDGIQLYDQFLVYMTQLQRFTFCIDTEVFNELVIDELQSNEDIQRSFIGRGYHSVTSYVHTHSIKTRGQCIIYSLPYDFEHFVNLNNTFQGGLFYKVRQLRMNDRISFEHEFFQRASANFPFLEILTISNSYPQNNKSHSSLLITFPYLKYLDLQYAHVDYAELFLF